MSTYNPIGSYLAAQPGPPGTTCTITFKQFQQLTGVPLPRSAFQHSAWWGNNPQRHVQAQAWLGAGWRVAPRGVDFVKQQVLFEKV